YTQIKAVWNNGSPTRVVGERFVDEGTMLAVNTPILTLIDFSSVTAEIDIIERDYHRIRIGQAVEVQTDAYPDIVFIGRLARLAPVLQETSRQARAEIDIPNPQGLLKPGMFVRVQTVYAQKENVITVPKAAIVKRGGSSGIFLANIEESTASFVPIQAGITDKDYTEILEPPISGSVVTLGQDQLQDGRKILIAQPREAIPTGQPNRGARP
ncbi:MAG: efflux RND transporter periplasmic adaptor subunit, partial [Candidatus Cloacimonadaceae bacterium]|nr:efflux RND transporter periplasmic adaptor subunit [Candidatus Cloacimonadaceae bacterium]